MATGKHDPTTVEETNVSRRDFIARSVAANECPVAATSPAATLDVVESDVTINTPDAG